MYGSGCLNLDLSVCLNYRWIAFTYFSFSSERLLALTGSAYQKKRRSRETYGFP